MSFDLTWERGADGHRRLVVPRPPGPDSRPVVVTIEPGPPAIPGAKPSEFLVSIDGKPLHLFVDSSFAERAGAEMGAKVAWEDQPVTVAAASTLSATGFVATTLSVVELTQAGVAIERIDPNIVLKSRWPAYPFEKNRRPYNPALTPPAQPASAPAPLSPGWTAAGPEPEASISRQHGDSTYFVRFSPGPEVWMAVSSTGLVLMSMQSGKPVGAETRRLAAEMVDNVLAGTGGLFKFVPFSFR